MDKDSILRKIKHCLALANSSNPHEAAAALRQAKKLMEIHGLNEIDVKLSDIAEHDAKGSGSNKPTAYETSLAVIVAEAFNCQSIYAPERIAIFKYQYKWLFIGISPNNEIAAYVFDNLYRQLKRSRTQYIKDKLFRCKITTKTKRADVFCEAWVSAVYNLIRDFSKINENSMEIIKKYMSEKYTNLQKLSGREAKNTGSESNYRDSIAGYDSGKQASINHGVGTTKNSILLR